MNVSNERVWTVRMGKNEAMSFFNELEDILTISSEPLATYPYVMELRRQWLSDLEMIDA